MGFSLPEPLGGPLFRLPVNGDRRGFRFGDPRLADLVADNLEPLEMTESESLLVGRDFGIITDIETGPNGNVFIVSLNRGAVYEIFRRQKRHPLRPGASLLTSGRVLAADEARAAPPLRGALRLEHEAVVRRRTLSRKSPVLPALLHVTPSARRK